MLATETLAPAARRRGAGPVAKLPHETLRNISQAVPSAWRGQTTEVETSKALLRERIANYKIPKTWSVLAAFASLPNGKVDKRAMQAALTGAASTLAPQLNGAQQHA